MESFSPGMERLQETPSVMGWNDSRGVSPGGTTPRESFCPVVERLLQSYSVLGWNDSRGVILSWDVTTPGGHSVRGWNDSRLVILSWME